MIGETVSYLESDAALASIAADPYWPKWSSPWWHMVLLWEMGEATRIPPRVVRAMIDALNRYPAKTFPIRKDELDPAIDPRREIACHCAIGCMWQVLDACGADVAHELPWFEPWLVRSQMRDGGLTCDWDAYWEAGDECASSMVGTVPAMEAMLLGDPAAWSAERRRFVDRAADFLVGRKLVEGSWTTYNAAERQAAMSWGKLTFPRFYLYDTLRGLVALLRYCEKTGAAIPRDVVGPVAEAVSARIERRVIDNMHTLLPEKDGTWSRGHAATRWPLLEEVSQLGSDSPYLARSWEYARSRLS